MKGFVFSGLHCKALEAHDPHFAKASELPAVAYFSAPHSMAARQTGSLEVLPRAFEASANERTPPHHGTHSKTISGWTPGSPWASNCPYGLGPNAPHVLDTS